MSRPQQESVLVNENGKIVAAVERKTTKLSGNGDVSVQAGLHARPGQSRHVLTMPPELALMPLKEMLRSCHFVQDADGPRLEKRGV